MEEIIWIDDQIEDSLEMEIIRRIAAPILEKLFEIEAQVRKPLLEGNIRIEILDSPNNDPRFITQFSKQADYSQEELDVIESIVADDSFLEKLEAYIKEQVVLSHNPTVLH